MCACEQVMHRQVIDCVCVLMQEIGLSIFERSGLDLHAMIRFGCIRNSLRLAQFFRLTVRTVAVVRLV